MKRLEDAIRAIRIWWWKRQGFTYHHDKRMWSKTRSDCHNAPVHQKVLYKGKPLTKPFSSYPEKERGNIYYRWFCDECGKECKTVTEVKV